MPGFHLRFAFFNIVSRRILSHKKMFIFLYRALLFALFTSAFVYADQTADQLKLILDQQKLILNQNRQIITEQRSNSPGNNSPDADGKPAASSSQIKTVRDTMDKNTGMVRAAIAGVQSAVNTNNDLVIESAAEQKAQTDRIATKNTFMVAMAGILAAFISPFLVSWQVNRNARRQKIDDYARQDQIAERASEAARQQLMHQDRIAARGEEIASMAAEKAATLAVVQTAKIDQIHTLVNSNLTAYMQATLDTLRLLLISLNKENEPSAETLKVIANTRLKIAELEAQIGDRLKSAAEAAIQLSVDLGVVNAG